MTRWDKELTEDLLEVAQGQSTQTAIQALRFLGVPESEYDPDLALEFLRDMCRVRAVWVNQTTKRELERALELEAAGAEGLMATPEGVFQNAVENRTKSAGNAIAAAVDGWSAIEAVRQSGVEDVRKRWVVTSSNPRKSHAAMNGVTVGVNERFPNGMDWPGDWSGGADEVCGCQCEIEVVREV